MLLHQIEAKQRKTVTESIALKINQYQLGPVLASGVLGSLLSPRILDKRFRRVSLDARTLTEDADSRNMVRSWNLRANYVIRHEVWSLIEGSSGLKIVRTTETTALQTENEAIYAAKNHGQQGAPQFIRLSESQVLIADCRPSNDVFLLADISQKAENFSFSWTLESEKVEAYHSDSSLLCWITRTHPSVQYTDPFGPGGDFIRIKSIDIGANTDQIISSSLKGMLESHQSDFLKTCTDQRGLFQIPRIFVKSHAVAILLQMLPMKKQDPKSLCLLVVKPTKDEGSDGIQVIGSGTHTFETETKVPNAILFAKPQIHLLLLHSDSSGLLFKHIETRVVLVRKWGAIPQLIRQSPDPEKRQLQCVWNHSRRSIVVIDQTQLDWKRKGSIGFFELKF